MTSVLAEQCATQSIRVSAGADEPTRLATVTSAGGDDITSDQILTCLCLRDSVPDDFTTPDVLIRPSPTSAEFAVNVSSANAVPGKKYSLYLQVVDGDNTYVRLVLNVNVW